MKFRSIKGLELLGIGGEFEIQSKQLLENQVEDVHHASRDLWNQNQHFHRHKDKMIFDMKGKNPKNVASSPKQCRKVVFLLN